MTRTYPSRRAKPGGFTLIEILVVIVIIGILVALLVPVIAGAVRNANNGRVKAEIDLLSNSITQFRDRYGDYPPSRIMLSEGGAYPMGSAVTLTSIGTWLSGGSTVTLPPENFGGAGSYTDITAGALAERSLRFLRKFWPRMQAPGGGLWHDFNGNGGNGPDPGLIYLQGHECLAFFLGGIPTPTPKADGSITFNMMGFNRDPIFPFKNGLTLQPVAAMGSTNRYASFFEFRSERLIDDDFDGIPGYVDHLGSGSEARYFAYFSAYGNGGYDPNDDNLAGLYQEDLGSPVFNSFRVNFVATDGSNPLNTVASYGPNPYTGSVSVPGAGQSAAYTNANTYQIISAGGDRLYGVGGQYNGESGNDKLPDPSGLGVRARERDNLTNFATSRLD